jgi:hypothetical protein
LPTSVDLDFDHTVNTQKGVEQTGLKFVQLNANSTAVDHLQNLSVALQSQ